MRILIPLSPDLGNSEIGGLLDTAEQDAGYPAWAFGDVEVAQGGEVDGFHAGHCALLLLAGETMICITFKGDA